MSFANSVYERSARRWVKDDRNTSLNFITVDSWKGPNGSPFPYYKVPYHIFHMGTGTQTCDSPEECRGVLDRLSATAQFKNKTDLRFNFIIGGDLNVYEARGFSSQPLLPTAYQTNYGKVAFLIGYIGLFEDAGVPDDMWRLGSQLTYYGIKNGFILPQYKHHRIFIKREDLQSRGSYGESQYSRTQYDRQQQNDRPQYDRQQYDGPQYGRPQYGRPQYDRPRYDRPQYSIPQYTTTQYDKPQYSGT